MATAAEVRKRLAESAFVMVNKHILQFLDGDNATSLLLSELIASHSYHESMKTLGINNEFPIPVHRYEVSLRMSPFKQNKSLKVLIEKNIAKTLTLGYPAVRHVILNFQIISEILDAQEEQDPKVQKGIFYDTLNGTLIGNTYSRGSANILEAAFDNMKHPLKGTMILLSKFLSEKSLVIKWSPKTTGQIKNWVARRSSKGKAFDYTIVSKTLDIHLSREAYSAGNFNFDKYIIDFMSKASGVIESHFSKQVHDYRDLLN
jgi:hypothetical protein